ncbi:MAG: PSD1 and planctomycete cytochrome C domain-containing protein [Isosphaeraceae bacterium]
MSHPIRAGRFLPFMLGGALAFLNAPALADDKAPLPVPADHAEAMKQGLVLFKEHVRPLLVARCLECHGGKATKGDLDLSDRKPLVESGVIDGAGKESRLYALVSHAEEPFMPMKGDRLPDEALARIARWIDLGAPYDRPLVDRKAVAAKPTGPSEEDKNFWSLRPLQGVAPPVVKDDSWVRTPIDRFILAKLESEKLRPNPLADRRVLIRRLTFDLLGLPPTPEEVDAFLDDPAPDAYAKLVDRLLASPRHGERWARHWMDVARFAESHGYEQDYDRPFAFHYRDFLIKAINQDLPYDQFIGWQVAGDELAPDNPLAMAATGFLGAGAFPTQLTEAEFESARYNELDDMTATTGSAFLGLSVGCARCHDHKYDPIASEEYYSLASIFTTTIRSEIDLPLSPGAKPVKVQVTSEGFPPTKHHADERGFPHFYAKTYKLSRGDVSQKTHEATPSFLRVLMRDGKDASYWRVAPPSDKAPPRTSFRRASLARWLTDTEHGAGHLAARVIVNRVWQHHFGRGIVGTPSDFGLQGDRPTHPELLDWLALDFIRNGWRLKRLHQQIVTSSVYMQDSRHDDASAHLDHDNRLHWRYTPRRLEAEPIRDAMLSVAGHLDPSMFGPGTLDPQMRRRSVYFQVKRSQLIPVMMLFDWPEHLVSIGQRGTTTTAPQALLFMNSPLGRLCAQGLAARLDNGPTAKAIPYAYHLAFGREPTAAETDLANAFLARQSRAYHDAGKPDPDRLARVDLCQALMSMSDFIYIP